ncbi:hypothetical protein GOP97_10870 [Vibrio cholerae]|nr:hypothetical protein [Vibrio cholerae]
MVIPFIDSRLNNDSITFNWRKKCTSKRFDYIIVYSIKFARDKSAECENDQQNDVLNTHFDE